MRSSRIFSGDFHTPNQKTRILPLFLRFLLAFPVFLGYSPCRPSISRKIEGSRTLGACFDRIGACPDCLGVESKIRRISRLDVKPMSKTKVVGHIAEKVGTPKKTATTFFDELFK